MKCKYLHDVTEPNAKHWDKPGCVLREDGVHVWPAGTIEEHPNAYKLVRNGNAEPADDECRLKAAMSSREMAQAQRHNGAVRAGIQPEDYQRFFDGEITGYDANGDDIPGPNFTPPEDDDDDDDD